MNQAAIEVSLWLFFHKKECFASVLRLYFKKSQENFKKCLTNAPFSGIILKQSIDAVCECAGIGRQARLRGVCRQTYGFKSHYSHQRQAGARSFAVQFSEPRICFPRMKPYLYLQHIHRADTSVSALFCFLLTLLRSCAIIEPAAEPQYI